jgi:hypothetical protein
VQPLGPHPARRTAVRDLGPLPELVALRSLELDGTKVTKLSALNRLLLLEELSVANTAIATAQQQRLIKRLPKLPR